MYPRVEKIDPRVQHVGSESDQKRLSMTKEIFRDLNMPGKVYSSTRKSRRGKKKMAGKDELLSNVAKQTANFMQEMATDQWDSNLGTGFKHKIPVTPGNRPVADLAPQFGPRLVSGSRDPKSVAGARGPPAFGRRIWPPPDE